VADEVAQLYIHEKVKFSDASGKLGESSCGVFNRVALDPGRENQRQLKFTLGAQGAFRI